MTPTDTSGPDDSSRNPSSAAAPQSQPSQDGMIQCLQTAAARASKLARDKGLSGEETYLLIGNSQKMMCGYSALK